jgi:hypothetical protein
MTVSASQATQMAATLSDLRNTTVAVETRTGEGAYGPVYAASANKTCYVVPIRRLVRNANGEEEVSEMTIHAAPADETAFTPGTRLTVATRISTVITASAKNIRGLVIDVEVSCT